ncbi:5-carboxymethyl-2-hydroxymuconate Delta-isomerase [Pontibacillus salicampi]|uniref:5-carboxymethyl-2-hydroxymuconate Delta-isomerase n=1 Tax=Pontibacillus salicampi TaxID=1449801 RepID=A0ABV6LQ68_9BACI
MPHIYVEYTENIKSQANMKELLPKLHEVLLQREDTFPIGGIRSRAIALQDYYVADGSAEDAFVHVTLKIGKGRSEVEKEETCTALFQVIEDHFSDLFERNYLALSLELYEFQNKTWKKNNIHDRFH